VVDESIESEELFADLFEGCDVERPDISLDVFVRLC
jgi:hypothetical protein